MKEFFKCSSPHEISSIVADILRVPSLEKKDDSWYKKHLSDFEAKEKRELLVAARGKRVSDNS